MRWLPSVVAAALGCGAALGPNVPGGPAVAIVAAAGAWMVALAAWRRQAGRTLLAAALAGIAAVGAASSAAVLGRALEPPLARALIDAGLWTASAEASPPLRLEGVLTSDAWSAGPVVLVRLRVSRVWLGPCGCPVPVDDEVQLSVAGRLAAEQHESWRAGRAVSTVAALRRPSVFRNTGAPDEARQRTRRRLAAVGQVKSGLQIEVRPGSATSEVLAAIRAHTRRAIRRAAGADAAAAAVATAILIGDRTGLDPALELRLQRAGTFHVVAISGGNIALWAAGTIWLTARLTRHRTAAMVSAGVILVAYAALVGGGASVQRATGMALVGLAARWADQRGAGLNVLALTAAVLVAFDPRLVVDVAFWLTTAATLGLVVGLPDDDVRRGRAARLVHALLLTSVCAEVALLPIVTSVFQQVTLAGLVLSAIAVPAMGVVQVVSLAVVVLDPVAPWLMPAAGAVLGGAVAAVTETATIVDVVPGLVWRVPPPSSGAIVLYYVSLGAWWWLHVHGGSARRRARRAAAALFAACGLWVAVAPPSLLRARPGDLQFVTFDVGQGAAALVHFPGGRRMLVDAAGATGRGVDLGTLVVGPALRSRGIRWLDILVVTHTDLDHAGGAASLIREFRPAEVWSGIPVAGDVLLQMMREAARDVGAAWREVRRGEAIEIDGVRVSVAHPAPPDWERQRVRNDDSVVLALDYGRVRLVLPGDVGAAVESDIGALLGARDASAGPAVAVLAAGHHGSAGSSSAAWLAALRPSAVVISAGPGNAFGHPAAATLERVHAAGAEVWRTDRDGEVTVRTDGQVVTVSSVAGRRGPYTLAPNQPR